MRPDDYQCKALETQADQQVILDRLRRLGPKAMQLDNAARGLCSDAGEVAAAVMKHLEYGRGLDLTNLLEEAGDCLWRIAQLLDAAGLTIEQAMHANLRKLGVRYQLGYSDEASANRDRAAEARAVHQDGHGFGHVEVDAQEGE